MTDGKKTWMLGHGAGATLLVAGASLFMNNLRECLGDVAEHANGDGVKDINFSGVHGMGFVFMNACMFPGLIWLCYLTFWNQKGKNGWGKFTAVLGCGAILGAGVLASYAI